MSDSREAKVEKALEAALDAQFKASPAMRRARAKFWANYAVDDQLIPIERMTATKAEKLAQTQSVGDWWRVPGFREWFLAQNDFEVRLNYLLDLALEAAEAVLLNDDPKAQSARVNMIKVVAEMAHKMPQKNGNNSMQILDTQLQKLEGAQLDAFIERQAIRLGVTAKAEEKKGEVLDVETTENIP